MSSKMYEKEYEFYFNSLKEGGEVLSFAEFIECMKCFEDEKYQYRVFLNKEPNNARLFKTEKDALDAYRILTMYGHKVTIEKKEVKK
ncbi:Uncharacterised protein [Klebsiella pneumoniae]|uniref:Uncharacterized protein n=1 Tax=Klebsiella pneumoniae TaxID=573 RepID=A0A2X3KP83_KLEPN|nr:Uncharacterised protein [Klebsiella pneumoniae]